jgi:hypothetical protein
VIPRYTGTSRTSPVYVFFFDCPGLRLTLLTIIPFYFNKTSSLSAKCSFPENNSFKYVPSVSLPNALALPAKYSQCVRPYLYMDAGFRLYRFPASAHGNTSLQHMAGVSCPRLAAHSVISLPANIRLFVEYTEGKHRKRGSQPCRTGGTLSRRARRLYRESTRRPVEFSSRGARKALIKYAGQNGYELMERYIFAMREFPAGSRRSGPPVTSV